MIIFRIIKAIFFGLWRIWQFRNIENSLRSLPMSQLISKWRKMIATKKANISPIFAAGATQQNILDAELILGCTIPLPLKEFYMTTNGLTLASNNFERRIYSLDELKYSGQFKPCISLKMLDQWKSQPENPAGFPVITGSFLNILTNEEEYLLPFKDIDNMLSLMHSSDAETLIITQSHAHYPIGTIFEVEGSSITRFQDLNSWLANVIATNLTTGA